MITLLSKQVDDIVKRKNINIDNEIDEDTDEKTKKKIKKTKAREILDKRLTAEYTRCFPNRTSSR